jgi:hypothetical protein
VALTASESAHPPLSSCFRTSHTSLASALSVVASAGTISAHGLHDLPRGGLACGCGSASTCVAESMRTLEMSPSCLVHCILTTSGNKVADVKPLKTDLKPKLRTRFILRSTPSLASKGRVSGSILFLIQSVEEQADERGRRVPSTNLRPLHTSDT